MNDHEDEQNGKIKVNNFEVYFQNPEYLEKKIGGLNSVLNNGSSNLIHGLGDSFDTNSDYDDSDIDINKDPHYYDDDEEEEEEKEEGEEEDDHDDDDYHDEEEEDPTPNSDYENPISNKSESTTVFKLDPDFNDPDIYNDPDNHEDPYNDDDFDIDKDPEINNEPDIENNENNNSNDGHNVFEDFGKYFAPKLSDNFSSNQTNV